MSENGFETTVSDILGVTILEQGGEIPSTDVDEYITQGFIPIYVYDKHTLNTVILHDVQFTHNNHILISSSVDMFPYSGSKYLVRELVDSYGTDEHIGYLITGADGINLVLSNRSIPL